jgi:phosphohistidine phosphatase
MDCILLRHGIAVDYGEWRGPEASRPLTPKGVEKTKAVAAGLRRLIDSPTHLLSSPLVRAVETAKIVQEVFGFTGEIKRYKELLPDAPVDLIIDLLGPLPPDARVFCVGHEPHLGQAAGLMLFGTPVAGLSLKKAGACCIRFEGSPKSGEGLLRWWMMPAQLRALAGD